jgi:phage protein U
MANYVIKADGVEYPLRVVESQTSGGEQTVIEYEAPGTNGGIVVVTGRGVNTITLTGKLLPDLTGYDRSSIGATDPLVSCNDQKSVFTRLKNSGKPVTLIAPVGNDDTGQYIISDFHGSVEAGIRTYLTFTMVLKEYRQANLKQTAVNLVSFSPAEEFKKLLQQRTV